MSTTWPGRIREALPSEYAALLAVEVAADTAFAEAGVVLPVDDVGVEVYADAMCVLGAEAGDAVAGGRGGNELVGVARIDLLDGQAHLESLAVHPAAARRGIGAALLEAAADWAEAAGHDSLTLCTFRDVAFNAPFYRRHGFVEVTELTPGLSRLRRHEHAIGLDAAGVRLALRRPLPPRPVPPNPVPPNPVPPGPVPPGRS